MGRPLQVVIMETSPIFLCCVLILLANTASARSGANGADTGKEKVGDKCDPTKGDDDCIQGQVCQDHDADGKWTCDCLPGYFVPNDDGFCRPGACHVYTRNKVVFHDDSSAPVGVYVSILIEGEAKCFYFDLQSRDYENAAANCKSTFNGNGRLFEPKLNKGLDTSVYKTAQKINKQEGFWIGVRTQVHIQSHGKNDFYYLTNGPTEPLVYKDGWGTSEPDDGLGNEDCVSVLRFSGYQWADDDCKLPSFSICEPNMEEGCGKPQWANDDYCDDENNHAACNWDGGACCNHHAYSEGVYSYYEFCEDCLCLDPDFRKPNCEDKESAKKCKKCKGKKCGKKPCNQKCKASCGLC